MNRKFKIGDFSTVNRVGCYPNELGRIVRITRSWNDNILYEVKICARVKNGFIYDKKLHPARRLCKVDNPPKCEECEKRFKCWTT